MKTINSVSGGRTSAYMAIKYPAELNVFAVVLTRDKNAVPVDKGLLRECKDRIPWFEASRELDITLANVLRLEQDIGRKIDWVASRWTLDDFIDGTTDVARYRTGNKFLPNKRRRFCTEMCKIAPIFEYWFARCAPEPCLMNIGFRADESARVNDWNCDKDKYKVALSMNIASKRSRHAKVEWRMSVFPLFRDGIYKSHIDEYWGYRGWEFPEVSNCDFCFHHSRAQMMSQAESYPQRVEWWMQMEKDAGGTFGGESMRLILSGTSPGSSHTEESSACLCTD